MNVGVHDGLARRLTIVQPNVESIWLKFLIKPETNLGDEPPQSCLNIRFKFVEIWNVESGHDERVAIRDWEGVPNHPSMVVLEPEVLGLRIAEGAIRSVGHAHLPAVGATAAIRPLADDDSLDQILLQLKSAADRKSGLLVSSQRVPVE